MRVMRTLMRWLLPVILLCSFCSVAFWIFISNNNVIPHPASRIPQKASNTQSCKACKDSVIIGKALGNYSNSWKKHEANYKRFRLLLNEKCHAVSKAVVTQNNTPLGSNVVYDGERRKPLQVTQALYNILAKEQPFGNATWESCAVVGNGGVLANSSCGEEINSAQFVIRCNLPPLDDRYEKDVGNKTNLVTANPSILHEKYSGLMERRRPFVESLHSYGQALLLLPAFSYGHNTPVSLRAFYTLEDFGREGPLPIFLNPEYLRKLTKFWREQGLNSVRPSTGLIMASLALEICTNVHLYGFWPFGKHPNDSRPITNHYYDNRESKKNVHSMPSEFEQLLKLHKQGVVHIHLGECQPAHR
ncbi:alpha-2,8-sialyltransferase 8F [Danio rerio]|uniref:Alpha-2,8-sialyltransferase 8F n=1 Tax=Danio rerio TaxID=7955 RepID=A0A8M9PXN4_DANRE|nr:alpha-2,8-sialyltransferase 8F [Danio rerio]XP_683398.2 alpha-2,8-sialyltransferase 8F [Danio rerio]|eukprot:XP_021327056.1 alpha-2,8-sialyltransferase 8F [Danio rerio]